MSRMDPNNENSPQDSVDAFRASIFQSFSEVNDPRVLTSTIRHELVHILFITLRACSQQLTLGQVKMDTKSNEISAIPKLLEMIDLAGTTIDILHNSFPCPCPCPCRCPINDVSEPS